MLLLAIAVAAIDHDLLRQSSLFELLAAISDEFRGIIWATVSTTQNDMDIRIALLVENVVSEYLGIKIGTHLSLHDTTQAFFAHTQENMTASCRPTSVYSNAHTPIR